MCGIVGYIGGREAAPFLVEGLRRLEYRGYDSAGAAFLVGDRVVINKAIGRVSALAPTLLGAGRGACAGIGHTRWATHGRPSDRNAHPHPDCQARIAVVHNGIVENHRELKVVVAPDDRLRAKTLSNLEEVKARDGFAVAVGTEGDRELASLADAAFWLPPAAEAVQPLLAAAPLQLLAYELSVALGRDVDQPRNLAKSVTVE